MYLILKIRIYTYLLKIHIDQLKNYFDLITIHSDLLIFYTQIAENSEKFTNLKLQKYQIIKITQNNLILFIKDTAITMK